MIPGEIFPADGDLILNADREAITIPSLSNCF